MIEAEYAIDLDTPVEDVWRYVEVIPNWAHFMIGFRKLQLVDDRRSIWTLRGDVGILARDVDIQVDITTWEPMSRAEFKLTGLTERLAGYGRFELSAAPATDAGDGESSGESGRPGEGGGVGTAAPDRPGPAPVGWWRRLQQRLATRLLRWLGRRSAPAASLAGVSRPTPPPPAHSAGAAPAVKTAGRSHLVFFLQIEPQGPMAPMLELLMRPMVEPAAQDFLGKLRQALEGEARDVDAA